MRLMWGPIGVEAGWVDRLGLVPDRRQGRQHLVLGLTAAVLHLVGEPVVTEDGGGGGVGLHEGVPVAPGEVGEVLVHDGPPVMSGPTLRPPPSAPALATEEARPPGAGLRLGYSMCAVRRR